MKLTTDHGIRTPRDAHARRWFVLSLLLFGATYTALWLSGGEARDLAFAGIEMLPFLTLAMLAYTATRYPWARTLTLIWLAVISAGILLYTLLISYDALQPRDSAALNTLAPAARRQLWTIGTGAALGLLTGWLCFLPPVRRALARLLPLNPCAFVHATALAVIVGGTLAVVVPLIVLGEPPLLVGVRMGDPAATSGDLLDDLYGLFWLVPAAVLAVGFPLARSLRGALARLGLAWLPRRKIALALATGIVMVPLSGFVAAGIAWLWGALGWTTTDTSSFQEMTAYTLNPLGALVVGITAGLGEELGVRGVLQPRLGILLSNLFFTALHAFQYNFDALLSVFLIGLVLGLIRRRSNTTASAIVHGMYDFVAIMISI